MPDATTTQPINALDACPRCAAVEPNPCTGDPAFGSRPLAYRHAGRMNPNQRRL